jgi:hypothetical protein
LLRCARNDDGAHKRVNPGNRSCRGSMLRFSFEIRSTKQQYITRTVVPADSRRQHDKTVGDSVDKPVRLGAARKKEPRQANELAWRGSPVLPNPVIRVINRADAGTDARVRPGDTNLRFRSNGARTHSRGKGSYG